MPCSDNESSILLSNVHNGRSKSCLRLVMWPFSMWIFIILILSSIPSGVFAGDAPAPAPGPPPASPQPDIHKKIWQLARTIVESQGANIKANDIKDYADETAPTFSSAGWPEAIAQFVVSRAQTEIALALLQRVKALIQDPNNHLQQIFPRTCAYLSAIKSEDLTEQAWAKVRDDFRSDIKDLPLALKTVADSSDLIPKTPTGTCLIRMAELSWMIYVSGQNPLSVLATLANAPIQNPYAIDRALYLAGAAAAIVAKWHEKIAKEKPKDLQSDASLALAILNGEFDVGGALDQIVANGLQIDAAKKKVIAADFRTLLIQFDALHRTYEMVRNENALPKLNVATNSDLPEQTKKLLAALKPIDGVFQAIADLLLHLGTSTDDAVKVVRMLSSLKSLLENAIIDDYESAAVDATTLIAVLYGDKAPPPLVLHAIQIVGKISSAKTTADRVSLIDAVADPASDFLNKRVAYEWYFNANAYLGGAVGSERVQGKTGTALVAAPFAPIGLEFGLGGISDYVSYVGVLGTFIDVGQLASTRLRDYGQGSDQSGTADSNVNFRAVVAPGAFLVFGITREFPLSFGFGFERTSNVRQDAMSGNKLRAYDASVFLSIDVPIMKLW